MFSTFLKRFIYFHFLHFVVMPIFQSNNLRGKKWKSRKIQTNFEGHYLFPKLKTAKKISLLRDVATHLM